MNKIKKIFYKFGLRNGRADTIKVMQTRACSVPFSTIGRSCIGNNINNQWICGTSCHFMKNRLPDLFNLLF